MTREQGGKQEKRAAEKLRSGGEGRRQSAALAFVSRGCAFPLMHMENLQSFEQTH